MNPFALLNPGRWMLYAAAVAAAVAGYFAWQTHERDIGAAPYIAAIEKQKIEAQAKYDLLKSQADALTKERETFTRDRNENDATNEGAIAVLADKLHAARLRDPYAAGCGNGGSGPTSKETGSAQAGAGNPAQTGGLLSAEFDGFLKRQARLADDINAAYSSCRAALYEAVK